MQAHSSDVLRWARCPGARGRGTSQWGEHHGAKSSTSWYLGGKERGEHHLVVSLEDDLQRSFARPPLLKGFSTIQWCHAGNGGYNRILFLSSSVWEFSAIFLL